jgi:DNA invertase Pin-like site-specific DNA recombinase
MKSKKSVRSATKSKGQLVGYVRVSSLDQNDARQQAAVESCDRVFTDRLSGKTAKRPELDGMLRFVRDGDKVVCHSMDRMARNLDDLRQIVLGLTKRGIHVEFVKEGLTFTGEDSPMAHLMLSVMGAIAEFERSLIGERQKEGIALAKKAGIYKGRKPALSAAKAAELRRRFDLGEPRPLLAKEFGISKETVYQYAGRRNAAKARPGYKDGDEYTGGRAAVLKTAQVVELRRRVDSGEKKGALALEFGISRMTLHRYLSAQVEPKKF